MSTTGKLLSFQDIKLLGVEEDQRSCFDGGCNRCLIRNEFAKEQNFRSQKIKYRLKAMGTQEKVEETEFFIFDIQDNHGVITKVWAFGIDYIMPEPDPVEKKPINLLIGNNFLSLHPSGGQGRNAVENLRALHSNFGSGWVISGAHKLLKPSSPNLSSQAVTMASQQG